jgi:hypothetical protein
VLAATVVFELLAGVGIVTVPVNVGEAVGAIVLPSVIEYVALTAAGAALDPVLFPTTVSAAIEAIAPTGRAS